METESEKVIIQVKRGKVLKSIIIDTLLLTFSAYFLKTVVFPIEEFGRGLRGNIGELTVYTVTVTWFICIFLFCFIWLFVNSIRRSVAVYNDLPIIFSFTETGFSCRRGNADYAWEGFATCDKAYRGISTVRLPDKSNRKPLFKFMDKSGH